MMKIVSKTIKRIANLPPIRKYRMRAYRREFFMPGTKWPRFYGLFSCRRAAETIASLKSELVGYDHPEAALISLEAMARTWTSDYPVLYWLSNILRDQRGLFDLGGHIGTKYLAWRDYLYLRDDFTWTVCDLPNIVQAGQKMSSGLPHLQFTTDYTAASDHDILLASGVLQYASFDLPGLLERLSTKPRHILLNKVPTHSEPDVFTLENLHHSAVPYRIFNADKLLQEFRESGYTHVDRWPVPESSVRVPFTDLGEPVHYGFYLRYEEDFNK